jgi:membrane protease YdiL (CAAX protease family)
VKNAAYLVGIVLAIGVGSYFAFHPSHEGQPIYLLALIVPTVLIAALGIVRATLDGVVRTWLRFRPGDFSLGFVGCVGLMALAWGFTHVVMPADSPRVAWIARVYGQLGSPEQLKKHVVVVVLAIIVAAAAEEVVWRGLVIALLEEKIGSKRAWVWAAVLYSVAHLPTAWALADKTAGPNPLLPLAALVCGLLWGGMARRFERLAPAVFSHILFAWAALMMFRLWGSGV